MSLSATTVPTSPTPSSSLSPIPPGSPPISSVGDGNSGGYDAAYWNQNPSLDYKADLALKPYAIEKENKPTNPWMKSL